MPIPTQSIIRSPSLSKQVQVGPFAVHTVELERLGDVINLLVDGAKLADSGSGDVVFENAWKCNFKLLGEKFFKIIEEPQV